MYVHILELSSVKCNKNAVFYLKLFNIFVMFGVCPNFPNKDLDKIYSMQLGSCNPVN